MISSSQFSSEQQSKTIPYETILFQTVLELKSFKNVSFSTNQSLLTLKFYLGKPSLTLPCNSLKIIFRAIVSQNMRLGTVKANDLLIDSVNSEWYELSNFKLAWFSVNQLVYFNC